MRLLLLAVLALGLACAASAQAQETLEGPAVAQGGFWTDWRFWQIVVTGALAFLGFTFGTWVKDRFDRRRDDRLRAHQEADRARDKAVLAMGLRAELLSLHRNAIVRIRTIDRWRDEKGGVVSSLIAHIDLPPKPVYASTVHRVGDLGAGASLAVVKVHGSADHIRTNIAAALLVPPEKKVNDLVLVDVRDDLLLLLERSLAAINALDSFLGDPPRYPDPQAILDEYAPAENPGE